VRALPRRVNAVRAGTVPKNKAQAASAWRRACRRVSRIASRNIDKQRPETGRPPIGPTRPSSHGLYLQPGPSHSHVSPHPAEQVMFAQVSPPARTGVSNQVTVVAASMIAARVISRRPRIALFGFIDSPFANAPRQPTAST
jgi:hypothetical protein